MHQKCSTEQKTRGQNVDPIKNYSQKTFVWIFPFINHNITLKKIRITVSNGARAKTKTVLESGKVVDPRSKQVCNIYDGGCKFSYPTAKQWPGQTELLSLYD